MSELQQAFELYDKEGIRRPDDDELRIGRDLAGDFQNLHALPVRIDGGESVYYAIVAKFDNPDDTGVEVEVLAVVVNDDLFARLTPAFGTEGPDWLRGDENGSFQEATA